MDIDLEQAYIVGYMFGQMTSSTYYSDQVFIESSPQQLPLYLNIIYTLDKHTWLSLGVAMLAVCITLKIATWNCQKQVFCQVL